jgi:hypothetical protein
MSQPLEKTAPSRDTDQSSRTEENAIRVVWVAVF